ncbi:8739_t:CDS:10 [Entrophospora sp. SA101]|nr:8563_t:CDS:10 [Entrophospora sp. SA101]CAJ0631469.1 8739_t:CDS:10 [Entrophospora sp. SA101]CAJ0845068.1 12009_t:CDS:10 [Entrophospora sp. SA101]CAJ0871186.1 341_t:CDS:10 [Entrophospora sp. SA101]
MFPGSSLFDDEVTSKRIKLDLKEEKEQQHGSISNFPIPYEINDSAETEEKLIPINYNFAKHGKDFIFPSHSDLTHKSAYSQQNINNNAKAPVKKLVIKPLKVKSSLPADYEEKTWAKLASAIQAIYSSKSVNAGLEELYKACENLCLHKLSKSLYQRLRIELEKHILLEGKKIQKDGDVIDHALIKSLIRMFIDLNIYHHGFENPFLEETRSYFMIEGQRLVSEFSIPQYLTHVSNRLSIESARAAEYLDKKTTDPLLKVIDEELIMKHVDTILDKGFINMVDTDDIDFHIEELKILYGLFLRVNALDKIRSHFGSYIKEIGKQIVNDTNNELDMVPELLKLKARMDSIVNGPFQNNSNFVHTVKETKYVDQKLRQGNKSMNDKEMEHMLNEVLILFRYIQGKDIFEAFYKRDLAKRLLLNKSASFDYEKSMLTKLRKAFEEMKKYKIDFSVNILTQGFWPTYAPNPCNLPPYMTKCQENFKDFYLSKHSGRNLKWQNSLGHCIISANFPISNKELVVSLYQAVILLIYNNYEDVSQRVTYEEIKAITGLEDKDLTLTLQSLACGKIRVLAKFPKGRDVNKTDEFVINEKFDVQYYRVKINSIQLKETLEEAKDTTERVFLDRQYQVDAALVRIMKMRKSLTYSEIITELLSQLKFKAMLPDIKKRIESLINREYLKRDPVDPSTIRYLA